MLVYSSKGRIMLVLCYDWVVSNFILWDIFGESKGYFNGRETYSLNVLNVPYPQYYPSLPILGGK